MMFQIVVYIPDSHLADVKVALFKAGAGRIGNYDSCAWETLGQGQYRPLSGSQPTMGQLGEMEVLAEYRLELVCESACLKSALTAMLEAHPYEEPAYSYWRINEDNPELNGFNSR